MTTIKVPRQLCDRLSQDAAWRGLTAAALIGELLDRYDREQRLAAVGRAYADATDAGYADETAAWGATSADGLGR